MRGRTMNEVTRVLNVESIAAASDADFFSWGEAWSEWPGWFLGRKAYSLLEKGEQKEEREKQEEASHALLPGSLEV